MALTQGLFFFYETTINGKITELTLQSTVLQIVDHVEIIRVTISSVTKSGILYICTTSTPTPDGGGRKDCVIILCGVHRLQ